MAGALGGAARAAPEFAVTLRPHAAGSEVLELSVTDPDGERLANVVFTTDHGPSRAGDPVGA